MKNINFLYLVGGLIISAFGFYTAYVSFGSSYHHTAYNSDIILLELIGLICEPLIIVGVIMFITGLVKNFSKIN